MILAEPELFVEFLRNFVPVDVLKDISPADIEDVTERLISLISEQKDGDTIKRINLKGDKPLFVIAIVEHESKVNYRASFKMLLYIALILDDYEKEFNRKAKQNPDENIKTSTTKDFKYPPVLPVIFYDGTDEWTAETNFLNRTEMSDIFEKYIPKFEYELVSLKDYSFTDLAEFGDVLSLFMIISKLKSAEAFSELGKLPKEYVDTIKNMKIPPHLKELLVKVITVLLTKINVPQDEIDDLVDKIDERGVSEMLAIENYDVQETRRLFREELREEFKAEADRRVEEERLRANKHVEEERQRANKRVEEERQRIMEEYSRRTDESQALLKTAVKLLLDQGNTVTEVATQMNISEKYIRELLP